MSERNLYPDILPVADLVDTSSGVPLLTSIPAGWPSPADDYIEDSINLHSLLIRNPASTYLMRAWGNSMIGAGILDRALLVVDYSLTPVNRSIVAANVSGERFLKRLVKRNGRVLLAPENPDFKELDVTGNEDAYILGVLVHAINTYV